MGERGTLQGPAGCAAAGAGAGGGGGAGAGAVGGGGRAEAGPAPPAGGRADLPRDPLEAVARAVPLGGRLSFRLVCRRWAAAGAAVAPAAKEQGLPAGKVTRMRGPDATASVARANMLLGVLDGPALERLKSRLCSVTAKGRHLKVLQCARTHGCP